ncbi:MAG TPA: hypothetical protein VFZ05_02465 [Nitrososphaera sp.]
MPRLMLKCKTCGEVFPGVYVPEGNAVNLQAVMSADSLHTCSRGHRNEYSAEDCMDWS